MNREPISTDLMIAQLRTLSTAFPSRHIEANIVHTAEVYRDGLTGISSDALRGAVTACVQGDNYFPKVARLRELAGEWTRRNAPEIGPTGERDPLFCVVCHERAEYRKLWRPKLGDHHRPLLTSDGVHVYLEPIERLLCACAAPCKYAPIDGVEPPMMLARDLADALLRRAVREVVAVVRVEAPV